MKVVLYTMTKMDDDGLPIVGPSVDMTKAPAINQKRTLAFINNFITYTAHFLNKFSGACEEKLSAMQMRIQRLEITLSLLEAKLASIPGLDQVTVADNTAAATSATPSATPTTTADASLDKSHQQETTQPGAKDKQDSAPIVTVSKDERYAKFFKMATVGVPVPAIKVKMAAEGLDPDLLDTPDAPAPNGGSNNDQDGDGDSDDNESSSEASSFSDSD